MHQTKSHADHAAVIEHYARLAPKYDRRWDRYSRATLEAVVQQIDFSRVKRLLDVACGTGIFAEMTRRVHPGVAITGVDLSPAMIEIAKQRLPPGDGVAWHVAPAEQLPVDDGQFDVVTCANAFHLVPDQRKALAEFRRVLKPGGSLVIVDWCREFPTIQLLLTASRMFGRQYRQIHTRAELSRLMEQVGLSVVHNETFKATWFWGMMSVVAEKV